MSTILFYNTLAFFGGYLLGHYAAISPVFTQEYNSSDTESERERESEPEPEPEREYNYEPQYAYPPPYMGGKPV